MSNRRERTLQDLCDATPTLSQPQITPILRGNLRMQGPNDEANCGLLTHMATSESSKGSSSCTDRSQKVDCKGKSGTCNVCSAPCSSCFHANNVLLKSNDESAGETCAGNAETGQLSVLSSVGGMDSTSDSFSENAAGKASSRTSNATASDDSVVHSKSEGRRSPEGQDECLSSVSGTDEHANRKSDTEDSGIKYKKQSKISGEVSDKVSPRSSQTRACSQNSGMMGNSFTKSTDDVTDLPKVQTTSQAPNEKYLLDEQKLGGVKDDKPSDTKDELLKGSTEHLNALPPSAVASDVLCGDPPMDLNSSEKKDDVEVEIHPTDETDDSDMVEDVKVCDICGDAGREDLLAVCSRCSDGAEHTYCMREMLEKVPEGEWLCEECKTVEMVGNGRQEKIPRLDENEKNNSSGQASENPHSSDVEGHRKKGFTKTHCKRVRDDDEVEVSSIAKKPALESIVGSPKTLNSSKPAALSRESSLKNLDRGRLQSSHHSSSDTVPVNDTTESVKSVSDPRVPNFRGIFSKSNSFNSLNSKPKVKLVDQVVIQRQKSAIDRSSFRPKEGAVRSIGKSMSFKSTNSSRSESKVKMLSPRLSHIHDTKNAKERSTFERQRSFRTEHPSVNSTAGISMSSTSRVEKRPASRIELSSLTTTTNHHEVKPVQIDVKAAALSRSSSLAPRRTADLSSSQGEFKRPSTYGHSTLGVSSANCVNNIEQKHNQTSLKQDSISEKPSFNGNEGLPDGSPRSKELTESGDRTREYSGSRFGPPSAKSSRDESDNLKAAIEAAVLRKPGVYRKHRASGQCDDSSMPTVGCEVASHQDHISSVRKKKLSSDAELPERPSLSRNLTADSLKMDTLNNVKQSSLVPIEGLSSGGRDGIHINSSSRDVINNVPAAMPLSLKSLAIPEHEYMWQGSFDICRSGQIFDLWDGIQAHLSTCASPKVIEAINKFKSKIVLYEVPRLSTWPVQFQEGVREDNIALFFFARDLESHVKVYKVLLDNMMKNDLALRGNIDGVELLIFPSSQLPENLQRWNMLYYLWGVFRGKKESDLQQMPESLNQYCGPQDIPPPIMSLPENRCSLRPFTENASEDAASQELRFLLSSRVVKRDFDTGASSLDQPDHGLHSSSSQAVQSDGAKQCQEMRDTCQEEGISSSCSPPLATSNTSSGREQMAMQLNTPLDRPQSPHHSSKSVTAMPKEVASEATMLDNKCHQNEVMVRVDARDLSTDGETPLEDGRNTQDLNIEHSKWLFSHRNSIHPGPSVMSRNFYASPSQVSPINNDMRIETSGAHEKMNHVPSGSYGPHNQHGEILIAKGYENAERRFFPVESQPVKGIPLRDGSMPWKTHLLEEDRLNDRVPNLELALGAERTPLTLGIEPLLISKVGQKVHNEHVLEKAGGTKAEDDVSASLSLSLAFPFPEKELNTKPAPKSEQLVAQRKRVSTSSKCFSLEI